MSKTSVFKRGLTAFMAMLLCLSSFIGLGTTTAYAAGEQAEVYMISFPRDGDANYGGDWGHPNLHYMNGWTSGSSNKTTVRAMGSYYRVLSEKKYEVVEGTCVGIVPKPLRKFRKIRIMDDEGNESALLLPKQSKVTIGDRYRFYFKQTQRISLGSEYFDAAMSSDCFLGYEQIGETAAES